MSNLIKDHEETPTTIDPLIDPVSYLASLGIEAELVSIQEDSLAAAA